MQLMRKASIQSRTSRLTIQSENVNDSVERSESNYLVGSWMRLEVYLCRTK